MCSLESAILALLSDLPCPGEQVDAGESARKKEMQHNTGESISYAHFVFLRISFSFAHSNIRVERRVWLASAMAAS